MKSIKRGQYTQKIIQSESLTQPSQTINWVRSKQMEGNRIINIHSEQSLHAEQSKRAISIINKLICQNSDLKKKIYHFQHQIAVMKLNFQSKQREYRDTIKGYKEMIDSMIDYMGYQSVQSFQPNYQLKSNKSGNNWVNTRQRIYERYLQEDQVSIEQDSRIQSLQSKSHSIQLQQDENPQSNYINQKRFILDPADYLNLNFRSVQNYDNRVQYNDYLPRLSSVTQVITPHQRIDQSQIFQRATVGLRVGKQKKAQTQRLIKNKEKEQGGRICSQGIYSTQSFKKIVQKGNKNRERINQILKNKFNEQVNYN